MLKMRNKHTSRVVVLGAGASHGERLEKLPDVDKTNSAVPPLITGFFAKKLYEAVQYSPTDAERDFKPAFDYIRRTTGIVGPVAEGKWNALNLEDVYTAVELDREFTDAESDAGARVTIIRNSLIRYIWKIIGLCTIDKYGSYTKLLVSALAEDDSVISFNWDLLVDQELDPQTGPTRAYHPVWHYHNFLVLTLNQSPNTQSPKAIAGTTGQQGLFLKMHGSLNWFHCTNSRCPGSTQVQFDRHTQSCLERAVGMVWQDSDCPRCGSETIPLLIPPLLRKPVQENWVFRSIWGLARKRLELASEAWIIGFSAAPTDFYAAWLLRTTLGMRGGVRVHVVNPLNDPKAPGHQEFKTRMENIFPRGYSASDLTFSEVHTTMLPGPEF